MIHQISDQKRKLNVLNIVKDYLPNQLNKMLTPAAVEKEFGISKETLKHLREESISTGKLRGPLFLKDGNIILYPIKAVIMWIKSKRFSSGETSETSKTAKISLLNK
jgi:hypothetical protein